MKAVVAALAALHAADASSIHIFGDSWGAQAWSAKAFQTMLAKYGRTDVAVTSSAIGGTKACQWSENPAKLADEVTQNNATHVWYTLGGNDMADGDRLQCLGKCKGTAYDACVQACDDAKIPSVLACAKTSLDVLFQKHPTVKVLNFFYDIPCLEGQCIPASRSPCCGTNVTCNIVGQEYWQRTYSEKLQAMYPGKVTTIDVLGAVQAYGGDKQASVGHPDVNRGSPCDLISIGCVHPGTQGWVPVTDAMWDLFWKSTL
eukprot:TRINITY_DN19924_c0_g2_i1.p1 TRINITY_DN19924_c0_g2~~TRINITY_DN19924_c0_g2_i1.p1  ORF type:complete len:285 (+),score=91.58 TRINITY_DN19924_c0_g2_i1:81-857(+)